MKSATVFADNKTASRVSRRELLTIGGLGMLGLNTPSLLQAESTQTLAARAKSVIFLFQWGGPSHLDTFDMKPDAPEGIRGPLKPIATSASGIQICERLPKTAQQMHHCSLIHTLHHTMTHHNSAGYYALSGHEPPFNDQRLKDTIDLYPAYGSVVDKLTPNTNGMPTFVAYPHVVRDGSVTPGQHASFLGKAHDPFRFTNDPNEGSFALPQLSLPADFAPGRMDDRRHILELVDQQARSLDGSAVRGLDQYYDRAIDMLTNARVRKAFDVSAEPAKVRDAYGRTTYGQGCLLARRLVEAGVKFVNVYFSASIGGRFPRDGWDTHGFDNSRMYPVMDEYHFPMTDHTLPVLLADLHERGLLESTLVVWMGEFGRTPMINKNSSRDHWPGCYTALLAGGGVKGGYSFGKSDSKAMYPEENPVRPDDLAATIYHLMGIDPHCMVRDKINRPLPIAGNPILDVIA